MKIKIRLFILLIFSCFAAGCSTPPQNEPISGTNIFFDTVINIKIFDSTDRDLLTTCFSYCEEFEKQISRTIPTSEISRINAAQGVPVEVSDDTIELLKKGIQYGELTDGKFDITIAPLSTLWDFKNKTHAVPDAAAIEEARSHVNYQNIHIDGNFVSLSDPEAAIDLGGIAKGYMADKLKAYLEEEGVKSALINLGGNVLAVGNPPEGTGFQIGIQKPFAQYNVAITSVTIQDQSVVSSGVYERYFELDDKIYHHILNPATGYPYENGLLGVSIISDYSVDGDALSTSCFALGLEDGMALIESLDNVEALFITEDYKIHDTRKK